MKEVKLRYDGTLFGKDTGLDLTPGRVYKALRYERYGKCRTFIYDDFSINEWGKDVVLIPHHNSFFINEEQSMHFTEVE